MTPEETAVKVAELDQRAKSNTRRIDKLEQQTEAVQELATSVKLMVQHQQHQTEAINRIEQNVEKLDSKVEVLEQKPAKRWESIVEKIIMTIIGGVIGYLLVKLGL